MNTAELKQKTATFELCLELRNEKAEDVLPHANPTTPRQKRQNDMCLLDYVSETMQQGKDADWNDTNERKWWPVFEYNKESGFGFSFSDYDYWSTHACCGSRPLPSEELADHFGTAYLEIHKRILLNKY